MDQPDVGTQRSGLLCLPGELSPELRNIIYDYCSKNAGIVMRYRPNEQHTAVSHRSLMQTTRQLRQEFRPIYMRQTRNIVYLSPESGDYIRTYYITASSGPQEPHQGDLTIVVPEELTMQQFNMVSLFVVLMGSPDLRFRFKVTQVNVHRRISDTHLHGGIEYFNRFLKNFRLESDINWRYMFLDAFSGVGISIRSVYPTCRLSFHIQSQMMTKWGPLIEKLWMFIGQRQKKEMCQEQKGGQIVLRTSVMLRVCKKEDIMGYTFMSISGSSV
ncbi:hypothetical protein T440DRAFT_542668 [Plenodomus tracheiphilus IPT5]|uniref:Uncharacterized protein n=1 Tax=Plenodomus tracheiphilus IPT5 TaxID=1408161 RepID=A0A6A7AVT5_9PLEO|nr:hypothetical protein T440DRAFT_542668 [Plenodomus tracheiphilus IPT5]